mmetsp:Transcript_65118/g.151241  ORF Transcript_65118/g.151241 Transcript_65118/m.151241 type:complete len:183 (-) Transcript_65118:142-690(-)
MLGIMAPTPSVFLLTITVACAVPGSFQEDQMLLGADLDKDPEGVGLFQTKVVVRSAPADRGGLWVELTKVACGGLNAVLFLAMCNGISYVRSWRRSTAELRVSRRLGRSSGKPDVTRQAGKVFLPLPFGFPSAVPQHEAVLDDKVHRADGRGCDLVKAECKPGTSKGSPDVGALLMSYDCFQ